MLPALVSIIVPCYNQAQFLPQAIESALAQTYSPIQIIVVDDGSSDNTAETAGRYAGVECVRQDNSGLAGARNGGFAVSKGEYVLFLDADDRLLPTAVAAHLSCFRKHPDAGFVVGDIDNITLDGSYLCSPRWPLLEGNVYEEILRVNHVANTIAVMFRRSAVEELGGFKIEYSPSEDVELLLRAARKFSSAHHRSIVAEYRRYPNTLSRRGAVMLPAILSVLQLQQSFVESDPTLRRAKRQGEAYWRDYFGLEAAKELIQHLRRCSPRPMLSALITLLWYVRWRLFFWPWRFRKKIMRVLRGRGKGHENAAALASYGRSEGE